MHGATQAQSPISPRDTSYRPLPTVSPPPGLGPSALSDLYAVQHGDIRLFSPDGPVIGRTTEIGRNPAAHKGPSSGSVIQVGGAGKRGTRDVRCPSR